MRERIHNILLEMSDSRQQKLKKQLFSLWDKTGASLNFDNLKYVGVDPPTDYPEFTLICNFFRQYIGGDDVAFDKFKGLSNNTFHVKIGGYDFKFKINDYTLVEDQSDDHIYLDDLIINLMPGGTVFVENENKRFFISDLFNMTETDLQKKYGDLDEYTIHEIVNVEIVEVIEEFLADEITNKTGIGINDIKSFE